MSQAKRASPLARQLGAQSCEDVSVEQAGPPCARQFGAQRCEDVSSEGLPDHLARGSVQHI
eukprot:7771843-Pyramimonas_sp.AAC.1